MQNIKEDAVTAGELSNMDTRKGKAQLKSVFFTNPTTSPAESQEANEIPADNSPMTLADEIKFSCCFTPFP